MSYVAKSSFDTFHRRPKVHKSIRIGISALAPFLIASLGGCGSQPTQTEAESTFEEPARILEKPLPRPADLGGGRMAYPYLTSSGEFVSAIFHPDGQVTAMHQGLTLHGEATSRGAFQVLSSDPPFVIRCESNYHQTGQIGICEIIE